MRDDAARHLQRVQIVERVMVRHPRGTRVHIGAPQLLGRHDLAGRGFDQRWPREKDRTLVLDDDGFVRHGRYIGPTSGAGTHDYRDLRDAQRRHVGLVVEDAPEMLAIGEYVVLVGQIGATGVDQINAWQVVLLRDLLRPQVLLHRHRKIRAAFDCGIVGHDHAFASVHPADAGDDAGGGHLVVIHVPGCQLRQLEQRRSHVEQRTHTVARKQFAPRQMLLACGLATALTDGLHLLAQISDLLRHGPRIGAELRAARVELRGEDRHR
jgi:hypothetical protein